MIPKQSLEINPSHPIIIHLNTIRDTNPEYAVVVAEQVRLVHPVDDVVVMPSSSLLFLFRFRFLFL